MKLSKHTDFQLYPIFENASTLPSLNWISAKGRLWTLDWTMDSTMEFNC